LRESGVQIERPVVPLTIELSGEEEATKDHTAFPVNFTLRNLATEKTENVKAKFAIGADGAPLLRITNDAPS
jgi:phenol 2-monooxygenase (NADPH)